MSCSAGRTCTCRTNGADIFEIPAGNGPQDGLVGYTGSTVSIRRGNNVFTFNERGRNLGQRQA